MTKDDMVSLLKSVGVDENTVTAMSNAYDIGYNTGCSDTQKYVEQFGYVFPTGEFNESKTNK